VRNIFKKAGKEVDMQNALDFKDYDLKTYDYLLMGCSTWDEGKLQVHFEQYYENLVASKPKLGGKKFALFGCGDSGYVHYGEGLDLIQKGFTDMGAAEIQDKLLIDGDPESNDNIDKISDWAAKLLESVK